MLRSAGRMHSRNGGNGWAGILGSEDLDDDVERTDPELSPLAGLHEEKTTVDHVPVRAAGSRKAVRLTLPRPGTDPKAQAPSPPAKLEVPVPEVKPVARNAPAVAEPSFDSAELMGKLDPGREPAKTPGEGSIFTKEVILTIAGGILVLAAAIAYSWSSGDASEAAKEEPVADVAAPPPITKKAPEPPVVPVKKTETPKPPEPPAVRKAAVPILSILSSPSGATVEIDGTIYGKTPLIEKLPNGPQALSIRLMKDNYKKFESVVRKNDAGHYSLNATLERASPR